MTKRLATLTSCLAIGIVGAGCGSDNGGGSGGGSDKPSDSGSAYGGGGGSKEAKAGTKVEMKDIQFKPMAITVKKGQAVQWTNNDSVTHNVTKEKGPGPDFKSSDLNGGDTYSYTFKTTGKFDYVCTIHPNQTGTVTVK